MRNFRWITPVVILAALLSGCGYSVVKRNGSVFEKDLKVGLFVNRSFQPDLEAILRKALVAELVASGIRPVSGDASLEITGSIDRLESQSVAFSANDKSMLYRVSITISAELVDRHSAGVIWKGVETLSQDYPATVDIALQKNSRDAAVHGICQAISRVLVTKMSQNF